MNTLHLGRSLGDVKSSIFKRYYLHQQLESLEHNAYISFDLRAKASQDEASTETAPTIAHKAGTNCIVIDQISGRYLVSGGADTSIRLWDLESQNTIRGYEDNDDDNEPYRPIASISKANQASHSHSITSLSIYPFDPTPTTLLTTSYDQSLLLTAITPTSLQPLHKFPLDFTAYTHAISPLPNTSTPLVAVGTAHPAPRLIDLRSALATHALPGHTGSIWSLAWHPSREHILISSSTAGQILAFDIRRATPAFASFNIDDNLGVLADPSRPPLDYSARAHSEAITGILFNHAGDKLLSASHDQRLRVWDIATGRNDLVHFGPRIRNTREGELKPVLAPLNTSSGGLKASGKELVLWPNDDTRGEIFLHELREGTLQRVLKTRNIVLAPPTQQPRRRRGGRTGANNTNVGRLTSGGRINALAFRPVRSEEGLGQALEMYSAHGDGRICAWMPRVPEGLDEDERRGDGDEEESDDEEGETAERKKKKTKDELDAERSRKRKRDLIEGLVEGLTKRPITFS